MANDAQEIRVASNGHISVGNYGVTLPTTAATVLDAGFNDLGYVAASGVVLVSTPNITDIVAWQASSPVRKIVNSRALTVSFTLLQIALEQFSVAFSGGSWSQVSAGQWRFTPPGDASPSVDYSLVVDWTDNPAYHNRFVVTRANVTDAVTHTLVRTAAADLPVIMTALADSSGNAPWYFLSDDPSYTYVS